MAEVVAEFIKKYVKVTNRSWQETERIFQREVIPVLGKKLITEVTRADVLALIDGIAERGTGYMANKTLAVVRKFWNWCLEKGKVEVSPVAHIKAPGKEVSRDRVLSDEEIGCVWIACDGMGWPFGLLYKLLLITGQRLREAAEMRWTDIDLGKKIWTVPRKKTKSDRLNVVPLSSLALEVLGQVPRIGGEYVFSTTTRSPISGFSKGKARLDMLILEVRRESAIEAGADPTAIPEWPEWRVHDLRRTVASGMARFRVEPWVVEKVLNHATGQLSGVAGVYNRWGYIDEKATALATWARHVEGIIRPISDNVVQLHG